MKKIPVIFQNNSALDYRLIAAFAFAWSWLLIIDVGRMAESLVIGYGILALVYAFIVTFSTFIAGKALRSQVFQTKDLNCVSVVKMIVCWALAELVLAWLLTIVFWGSGSSWDDMLPFGSLAPFVMHTPLRFLTRLFGYFGTSAVVGVGLLILVKPRTNSRRRFITAYWAILLASNLTGYMLYTNSAVTHDFEATIVSEQLGKPEVINASTSFVLLPEYGLDYYTNETVQQRLKADQEVYFSGTALIDSLVGSRNVLTHGSNKQGYIYQHPKSRLIVGGEFMPYPAELILKNLAPITYDSFKLRRQLIKGSGRPRTQHIDRELNIGNSACSSIMNPEDYRHLTSEGATVLANSASLEIFRGSRLFGVYHDGFAKFMATANARPFLQSANNWKAFALDHNGNTIASVSPTRTQQVKVRPNNNITLYTYLGEWVAYLGGAFITVEILRHLWRKKHATKR